MTRKIWEWTPEADAILRRRVAEAVKIADIAAELGCHRAHVYVRCRTLKLVRKDHRRSDHVSQELGVEKAVPDWTREELEEMNEAFRAAMKRATVIGSERVREGVVTSPCTHYARPMEAYRSPLTRSIAADVAALGAVA